MFALVVGAPDGLNNRHALLSQSCNHNRHWPVRSDRKHRRVVRAHPGQEGDGKHTIGPDYKIDPDLTDRGNAKGKSFEFTMLLADSKIFRGDDPTLQPEKKAVRKERKIFVYVPALYQDGTKAPILVIHDGPGQLNLVRNALDNLTISKDPNRKFPASLRLPCKRW
jgi:hypothetical protein